MVIFGSGGHTTEMLMMIASSKDQSIFDKYNHTYFVIGASDSWSYTKIKDFFMAK